MTTLLSAFRPRIAQRIHSCPDPLLDQAVIDTVIDLCERSLLWKATLDPVTTIANKKEYDLDAPKDTKVVRVMHMWCNAREMKPMHEDVVTSPFAFVRSVTGLDNPTSTPHSYVQPEADVISLHPTPDAAYTLTLRVALRPARDADCVPDLFFEDWVDTITHGALARLYAMPEFVNPTFAVMHATQFQVGVNAAMIHATRARTVAETRVSFPRI